MSLAHFRNYDADWHIGGKYISANNSDFLFLTEGNENSASSLVADLNLLDKVHQSQLLVSYTIQIITYMLEVVQLD